MFYFLRTLLNGWNGMYDWGEIESAEIQSAGGVKIQPTIEQGQVWMKELSTDHVVRGWVLGATGPITFISHPGSCVAGWLTREIIYDASETSNEKPPTLPVFSLTTLKLFSFHWHYVLRLAPALRQVKSDATKLEFKLASIVGCYSSRALLWL